MEKPRKKETYEYRELNGMVEVDLRYNAGWNDSHDAVSTWLEGEVPSVEEIKNVMGENFSVSESPRDFISKSSKSIHAILMRKLTGK